MAQRKACALPHCHGYRDNCKKAAPCVKLRSKRPKALEPVKAPEKAAQRREHGKIYDKAIWTSIRDRQIATQPLCECCLAAGIVKNAAHVDHIIPHLGDVCFAYDVDNLQSLCHGCHSRKTTFEQKGLINFYTGNAVYDVKAQSVTRIDPTRDTLDPTGTFRTLVSQARASNHFD